MVEAERLGCEPGDVPGIASFPGTLLSKKSWAAQEVRRREWEAADMRVEEMHKAAREEAARVE